MTIQAIPTRYKGYHFRSRLEARWAVFFDAVGWKWEYEPQGFDLGDGIKYLPDFLVADHWVEVKAAPLTPAETEKAKRLCRLTEQCVILAIGTPEAVALSALPGFAWDPTGRWDQSDRDPVVPFDEEEAAQGGVVLDVTYSLSQYCLLKWGIPGMFMWERDVLPEDLAAVAAARSARFEHGECGAT
jgi:hypothetical protein